MDQWTPRTTARAELAEMLLGPHAARARAAGLVEADLEALRTHGRKAERADRLQREQLAQINAERTLRKELNQEIGAREDALRDRLPAVIGELSDASDPSTRELGLWLGNLSFARYRFREITPSPAARQVVEEETPCAKADSTVEELRSVKRVERADTVTRMRGLEAFCEALLRPGREPIVKVLAQRGLSPDDLRTLADDARHLAELGRNVTRAAEATSIEAEAARAQNIVWRRIRRMLRKAVQGVPELEKKWAEC